MTIENSLQEVTIVGGGFAGLAAALRLQKAGVKLQLVEKRPFFGGRAYSFRDAKNGEWVDNGQHLLMGAYRETLAFLRELGTFDQLRIQEKLRVTMISAKRVPHTLDCPKLPAPFHLALGLLKMNGLSLRDKVKMLSLVRACQNQDASSSEFDDLSVQEFLARHGQTDAAIRMLWEPITLATLNEPLLQASAQLFKEVLSRSLLSSDAFDSRMIIPKVSFQELYAQPAQKYLEEKEVPVFFQSQLLRLEKNSEYFSLYLNTGKVLRSKKVLLAMPPDALKKVLDLSSESIAKHYSQLEKFKGSPIISMSLWFKDLDLREDFVGLIDSPIHWIFNKSRLMSQKTNQLALVISGAYHLKDRSKEELLSLALQELKKFYPHFHKHELIHSQVVKEHHATYSGRLGLGRYRPAVKSQVEGLYLAGDWVDTRLPATIESAVLSGHQAASAILEN